MLRGMTIYEIKSNINTKLNPVCSSSSGSIHTAIRKLLEGNLIEYKETGNKKVYYITAAGRETFEVWIHQPMTTYKHKDIELSKLFFGGLTRPIHRKELIQKYITELEDNLKALELVKEQTTRDENYINEVGKLLFSGQLMNEEGICKSKYQRSDNQIAADVYQYQMMTLQYGIDSTKFAINWYQKILEDMNEEI